MGNTIQVNRVEKHLINKDHKLYEFIDQYASKTNSLYNRANYLIRQVYTILSKEELTQSQIDFIKDMDKQVDLYNIKTKFNYLKSNNKKQIYKPLSHFDKKHRVIAYNFLDYLLKNEICYQELLQQVAQQVLMVLCDNWKSYFALIKDYKKNHNKYEGIPKIPHYKSKNGSFKSMCWPFRLF